MHMIWMSGNQLDDVDILHVVLSGDQLDGVDILHVELANINDS